MIILISIDQSCTKITQLTHSKLFVIKSARSVIFSFFTNNNTNFIALYRDLFGNLLLQKQRVLKLNQKIKEKRENKKENKNKKTGYNTHQHKNYLSDRFEMFRELTKSVKLQNNNNK